MSCRILRAGDGGKLERPVWPGAAGAAGAARTLRAPPAGARRAETGEIDRGLEEARAAGFEEGQAAGRREIATAVERMARVVEGLLALRPRLRKEAEADLVRLAVAIARRILRRELAVDPEAIRGLVQVALEKLEGQEVSRVRADAALAPALRTSLERLAPGKAIEVVADAALAPGDAVFETGRGNLDASVGTQLEEIERGLADCLRRKT